MNYHFLIKVTPFDFFKMSMKKTYKSPIGICNIVFSVAVILMTIKFFANVSEALQVLLVVLCLIFPVFQPLGVYFKAKALSRSIPEGLTLDIDESGILVSLGSQKEKIVWNRVNLLIDNKDMLIIKVDGNRGYFLTNRVLKDKRDEFKRFAELALGDR